MDPLCEFGPVAGVRECIDEFGEHNASICPHVAMLISPVPNMVCIIALVGCAVIALLASVHLGTPQTVYLTGPEG